MAPISDKRENITVSANTNPITQDIGKRTSRYFNHEGVNKAVFIDEESGKEFILNSEGKKVYISDYTIFKMKELATEALQRERENANKRLQADFDNRIAERRKAMDEYFAKADFMNQKYNEAREVYSQASKGKLSIESQTGCNSKKELKLFDSQNGTNFFTQFVNFLTQKSDASSQRIKSEAMCNFYGRMACDESEQIRDYESLKAIAEISIFNV